METAKGKRKRKCSLSPSEKKRRLKERRDVFNRHRIVIGNEFDRWRSFQKERGLKSDTETAKYLLDSVLEKPRAVIPGTSKNPTSSPMREVTMERTFSTSTPKREEVRHPRLIEIHLASEISSVESDTSGRTLTGVESIPCTDKEENISTRQLEVLPFRRSERSAKKKYSSSFIDPFELSIDISQEVDLQEDQEDYDSDYEPIADITAVLPDDVYRETAELTLEDVNFGTGTDNEEETESQQEESEEVHSGIVKIKTEEDCEVLTEATTCLVFLKQLLALAETPARTQCRQCQCAVHIDHHFVGSALYLKWACEKGHIQHRWCSQPILNRRLHSGDFLTALSIVASGNNYRKVALLARLLNLKLISETSFHKIQGNYLVPAVDDFWEDHQREVLLSFRDQELIVLGDGRMDSPGHSAQYCSYTVLENTTKKVLMLKTLDKRVTDRKSANMEKLGFQLCMEEMKDGGLLVKEVVTDAHLGIGALMKTQYPNIDHSNDVWHAAKNLGKKLLKAGQRKDCGILLKWSKDIVNHFWFCCKKANTYAEFVSIWRGILNHITNQHSWALSHVDGINHCYHEPLTDEDRDKPWLNKTKDSAALSALATIILDKRFLNRIHYLLNFRSTAELEVFNQLILMYCAKRFAYSPPVYRMRNLLAALDHNMNVERPLRKNKEGQVVYNRYYNKKSARWSVFPTKVEKSYVHIRDLAKNALITRLNDKVGMKPRQMELDDPRRISKHLAPISPEPTHELVQQHLSRFQDTLDQ